jgi:tRNA (cmo5U34)-methyltransferase
MANVDWDPDGYLDAMLAEIPRYLELQEQVAAATDGLDVSQVLELGVGSGETARRVLQRHPGASWTAVDASEAMLGRAREALPDADLRHSRIEDPLPAGPFDLVVTSLVVHHLDGAGKQDLFRRVLDALRPEGVFVLGDVVVPDDPADAQIEIDWVVDLPDRLGDQLGWLRAAGFEAEPTWSYKDLAVVRATRPQLPG